MGQGAFCSPRLCRVRSGSSRRSTRLHLNRPRPACPR
jgi:hypothetical protein